MHEYLLCDVTQSFDVNANEAPRQQQVLLIHTQGVNL